MRAFLILCCGVVGCDAVPAEVVPTPLDAAEVPLPTPDAAPPCANGVADVGESDVDCGGVCGACANGRRCTAAADCLGGYCVALTGRCGRAVAFAAPVLYAAGFKPYAIAAGDLDGDGDVDLVVANELESTVAIYRNNGAGAFTRLPAAAATGEYPTGMAIADFDHDGIPDVITADYHGNSVSLLRGTGVGASYRLAARASYLTAAGAETSNVAVGDLDGDGLPDAVASNPQAHSISVFLARPGATLSPATNLPCGPQSEPYSVAIGDFDGDGAADLAAADDRSRTVVVMRGRGDGRFDALPAQPAIEGTGSFILLARDMNRDGVLDLVVSNRSSHDVSVLLGRGDGTFHAALVATAGPLSGPYALAVADFNLDGVPDVVVSSFLSGATSVLLGRGDGRLAAPLLGATTGAYSYGVAAADLDGDGIPDLAVVNAVNNTLAVVLGTAP
ncbi:MAG: VCBS repeat-containing protein [Deltaproteobacteria bacterium]|nr:VCBS repeat-containing protein [Deltaproteobacteria bacterium]